MFHALSSDLFRNANTNARSDPKVEPAVKTTPDWVGMDVVRRLDDCATIDPKHIPPRSSGPQVTMVHQALEKIAAAASIPVPPVVFGKADSDEVAEARKFNAAIRALKARPISARGTGAGRW